VSWISFEGFAESSGISADKAGINDSALTTGTAEARVRASTGQMFLDMRSSASSGVKIATSSIPQVASLPMDPISAKESEVFALMGYGLTFTLVI
jgi:hypothetical protein